MRFLAMVVLVTACGHKADQSYADGVRALCDLPNHVPPPDKPYDLRLAAVEAWAEEHITNPEAKQIGREGRADLAKAVAKANVEHCLLLDYGMELQSFADAMTMVCSGSHDPAWFKSHLLNAEVIRLVGALGDVNPAERAPRMREAIARAGLTKCPAFETEQVTALDVPTVAADAALVDLDTSPTAVVTPQVIVVEGKPLVAIANGDVDASEKEGGAMGIKIVRVANFAAALAAELTKQGKPPRGMTLVVTPATPYRLLTEVMYSVRSACAGTFFLAVKTGTAIKAIPIDMPTKVEKTVGLGMAVAITRDRISVWSLSGQEGTLKQPKQELARDHVADLAPVLAAIAAKHPDDHAILVIADAETPTQVIATVLAAARPAFPTIHLGSGFE